MATSKASDPLVDLQKRPTPDDPELAGFLDPGLSEPPAFDPVWFDRLLLWAADHDVSDVTIQAGNFVFVERFGRLSPITRRRWSAAEAYGCAQAIYGDNAPSQLAQGEDIDCSYEIRRGRQDLARYRVNMTAARAVREWGLEITIRTIPTTPPTLDQLELPTDLYRFSIGITFPRACWDCAMLHLGPPVKKSKSTGNWYKDDGIGPTPTSRRMPTSPMTRRRTP